MNATENKRSIVVGILIFLGIVIFITGILVLGGQQKRFIKSINLIALFNDVGGLKTGNNVWFSGVKIGTVKRIRFYGNSQVEVDMSIEKDAQQYIRKDAKASISTDGLIGNKIVVLAGGSTTHPSVEDGDRLQTQVALSSDQIMETLQENNRNLLKVTTDFKNIVSRIMQGRGMVGAVLTDSVLAENFRGIVTNLRIASEKSVKVSTTLTSFAAKMNTKGTLMNELVSDTTLYADLHSSVNQLKRAASTAVDVSNEIKKASYKLSSKDNAIGVLLNDQEVNKDLKNTIRNMNSSSQKLDENLEALQHSFLLRGYFRRKAKNEAKRQVEVQPVDTSQHRHP